MPVVVLAASGADAGMTNLTTLFGQFTTWMQSLVATITSNPILMLTLGIFVTGAVISLAYRLIRG